MYSHSHQRITQQQPNGPWGLSEVTQHCDFQPTHAGVNTAKSSLVGPHVRADHGKLEIAPGTLSLVRGSIEKSVVKWDLGENLHTLAATRHPSFAHHAATRPKTAPLGPISTTRRARRVLCGSPWVHTYSHCHKMITQQWPKGLQRLSKVTQTFDFSANPARKRVSPHRWGWRGGADLGKTETAPGVPVIGLGVHPEQSSGSKLKNSSGDTFVSQNDAATCYKGSDIRYHHGGGGA